MDVRIKLSPEAYEHLLKHIPQGLQVRQALEQAQLIRSRVNFEPLDYELDCDDDLAWALLRFAQTAYPPAVREIDFALRAARPTPPPRRRGFHWG
jgi:hypothetical protein